MKHHAYSIKDAAINVFTVPIFVQYEAIAVRYFNTLANDTTSDVGKYPNQFDLFFVGEFDDDTGVFEQVEATWIASASSFVKQGA